MSSTSAERFARRVRSRRRAKVLAVIGALAALAGLGWVVLGSPWLRVETVTVTGTVRVDPADVQRAAGDLVGRPMVLADTSGLAGRVRGDDVVRSVRVDRVWPATLRVTVVERTPVAAVPGGPGVRLVDRDGVVVEEVARAPAGLAVLQVDLLTGGASALRAGLEVINGLPQGLRSQVRTVGADSPDRVWLVLTDGSRVEWGGAEDTPLKADVLAALRPQNAKVYDVSAPLAPAVRGTA